MTHAQMLKTRRKREKIKKQLAREAKRAKRLKKEALKPAGAGTVK